MTSPSDPVSGDAVTIAGAGIAGLTAALAFAATGRAVRIFERAERLEEIGAGLQLSPNATRILDRLGVVAAMDGRYSRPEAVTIRDARTAKPLADVRLGDFAADRWGAPYLVAGRGALQSALLARVAQEPLIELVTGTEIVDFDLETLSGRPSITLRRGDTDERIDTPLLVGADGVWSSIRKLAGPAGQSRALGELAWRTTLPPGSSDAFRQLAADDRVTTFVAPGYHVVAYPLGGGALNIVVIAKGRLSGESWDRRGDPDRLATILQRAHPVLASLAQVPGWTVWPLHIANPNCGWTHPNGLVLIGDAAHALAPFAAQGAAMAIEDAFVLANLVAAHPDNLPAALSRYEALRRPRVRRVGLRGGLNHFAWHARGPIATVRNIVLKTRSAERLATDLDWLYGFDAASAL